jgi:beta-lactamase class A
MAGLALGGCIPRDTSEAGRLEAQFRLIEVATGGTFGIAAYDTRADRMIAYRGDERFALASTFKASLAAFAMTEAQAGRIDLDERTFWTQADFVFHRPFTGERVDSGATWRELAYAAQTQSDNVAANLLLKRLGGPEALTAFWRSLGDPVSRLDRFETDLNRVPPGTVEDTTTPATMARTLATLLFAEDRTPLVPERRQELRRWMAESVTGLQKIRAGLPRGWEAGDKTGNSSDWPDAPQVRGDIGFVIGPLDAPVTFAAYHRSPLGAPLDDAPVDAGFAAIGRALRGYVERTQIVINS